MKVLILVIGTASALKSSKKACYSNQECISELGSGACCLYIESKLNGKTYTCHSQLFVDYYIKSEHYDEQRQVWKDPNFDNEETVMFCRTQEGGSVMSGEYPYP